MTDLKYLCLVVLLVVTTSLSALCQGGQIQALDNVDERMQHQRNRIKNALDQGWIDQSRAEKLRQSLNDLGEQIQKQRRENSGALKPEQLQTVENVLNDNNQLIKSIEAAGKSIPEPGSAIGPKWSTGPDGAQDAGTLLNQMKRQEKGLLRQERQALEQKTEQQQLKYEREMLPHLGDQRRDIIKQEGQTKQIRTESGAN